MLTHGNMIANILQARAWFKQVEIDNTTYVCALPLYHIFSLTANCLLFASLGGAGHLITNPRDFRGFVKELRRHPPMFFMGVNTLFNALMNTPGFTRTRLHAAWSPLWAAAWPCSARSPSAGNSSPAVSSPRAGA